MEQYYYLEGNERKGPVSMQDLLTTGLHREKLVWKSGMQDWAPAASLPELENHFLYKVPPPPPMPQQRVEVETMEAERLKRVRERNVERLKSAKKKVKNKLRALADKVTAKGVKIRYRLYNMFFWLSASVVPAWLGAHFAVERARDNYWLHEWIYPEGELSGWTRFVMDNHIHPEGVAMAALGVFAVLGTLTLVSRLSFLHYAWKGIQDGDTDISPNAAVGYLMIPGYHFIWMFTAYKTLADEMRELILERGYEKLDLVKPELANWFCITRIASFIPLINMIAAIPMYVFNALFHRNIKNGLLYIIEQRNLEENQFEPLQPQLEEAPFS